MPDGYDLEMSGSDFLSSPCTNGMLMLNNNLSDHELDLSQIEPNQVYIYSGNSNKNGKCSEQIGQIFPHTPCLSYTAECSFNNTYLPAINNSDQDQFLALSNYYEAFDYTQQLFNTTLFDTDLNRFKSLTEKLCSMNYKDVRKKIYFDLFLF